MAGEVEYSASLRSSLEESLKSAFSQPYLRLTSKPKSPGGFFHVRLENFSRLAHYDDGLEQGVIEILTSDRRQTPFSGGFVALFELGPARHYALRHASLSVFHDIVGEPIPLFRAEWDEVAASDKASQHAQPHWHFVQSPRRIESIIRTLMKPSGQTGEFSPEQPVELLSGLVDCGRFHFAMTSMWEKSETPPYQKRTFDSVSFPKWFRNLSSYVADQIAYLVTHMPPESAPEARPFVPSEAEADG